MALVLPAVLGGCIDIPPAAVTCADRDGDHWLGGAGGACDELTLRDCDDDDAAIHPGAREVEDAGDRDCFAGVGGAMPPLTLTQDGQDLSITLRDTVMGFEAFEGHAMTTLRIAGGPQLLHDTVSNERYVGVEAWPSFFSWGAGGAAGRTVPVQTDTVVQMVVTWSVADVTPPGAGVGMQGTTRWTFHADGRVFRREEATVVSTDSISNVTTYIALGGDAATSIDWAGSGGAVAVTYPQGTLDIHATGAAETAWLCAASPAANREIGMMTLPTVSTAPGRPRITGSMADGTAASRLLSLQYDWKAGASESAAGSYAANIQQVAGGIEGDPCEATANAALAWASPPTLTVTNGSNPPLTTGEDNNGDGFAEGAGYYPIVATGTPLEIAISATGVVGRAVSFRIAGLPPGDPVVELLRGEEPQRLGNGRDYLLADDGEARWLVVEAIAGDTLRLTSP